MNCALFGGSGFIGQHFAKFLLEGGFADKVFLVDLKPPVGLILGDLYQKCLFVEQDLRKPIKPEPLPQQCALICNFAAVHREPGHEPAEYYETNIAGAENVCAWAEHVGCNQILFTSSIAPYGPSEVEKDERALTAPVSAYGGSKLVAEKIHQLWRAKEPARRKLAIVRPGVVFGPYEGGNVSRLIKSVLGRYMVYTGNREVRKAGIYVKELSRIFAWALSRNRKGEPEILLNATMNPGPSVEEYVEAICEVAGVKRWIPTVPFGLLYAAGAVIEVGAGLVRRETPINRVRLNKLVRANNIKPGYLIANGYKYQYNLTKAMADWQKDAPEEWQ
ncbi:MAG: NAD(P)-dependent oxidoreductase [Pseudomonadales bacterium]